MIRRVGGWLLVAGVALGGASAARACVGDCNGDGVVSVAELVDGVRIILAELPLSACPAFETTPDGELRIDELVAAAGAALDGCPATPSPTVTPSPPPTAVDTATPTVPNVAGRWREDPLAVTTSSCADLLTQEFAAELAARAPCEQMVEAPSDSTAVLIDCTGTQVAGTLDRDGTLHFAYPPASDTTDGCTVTLTTSVAIPAASSPTTAAYTFAIAFAGACPLADCTIGAQAEWTRE